MTITVRFFASIRERLGKAEDRIESRGIGTVADVWARSAGGPPAPNTLAAINQEYAGFDAPVRDGDEVAFFPPVTGGSGMSRGAGAPCEAGGCDRRVAAPPTARRFCACTAKRRRWQ